MNHLHEGAILSLRDRPLADEESLSHVEVCPGCQQRLDQARSRAAEVEALLASLDAASPDVEAAKSAVRARLDSGPLRAGRRTTLGFGRDLRRAAAILLVAAGAVSALPGSPVRRLLTGGGGGDGIHSTPTGATAAEPDRPESAVAVRVPDEGMRILLVGASAGSRVDIVWSVGPMARVTAAEGSTFSYANGRLEADLSDGPVRLELPRGSAPISLEVDGRMLLSHSGNGLQVFGPIADSSDAHITLTVPGG